MSGFIYSYFRAFSVAIVAVVSCSAPSFAERIGGSNLPSPKPSLKGRISDDQSASSVIVLSTAVGATTNAGPTFAEESSAFLDRGFDYAAFRNTSWGRLDFSLSLADRLYPAFDAADTRSAGSSLSLVKDWGGQETAIAFTFATGRDVEERLTETGLTLSHTWTQGTTKPYIKADVAWLDYEDLPDLYLPVANQDDRDRISSRVQGGLRLTINDHVEIEVGAGVDSKRYLERYDDFGLRRDSISVFPVIGVAFTGESGSLRALYMPFWRNYSEALFEDAWKHGYAIEGEYYITDNLRAFGTARYGFQETDFLIASAAYEAVAVGGLVWTVGKGTVALAASETWRTYDGLELIGTGRADEKFEMALSGSMPLLENITLNGSISYLDYKSSFGDVRTDAITGLLGLSYTTTQ